MTDTRTLHRFKQVPVAAVGTIPPLVTSAGPSSVEGELQLTQAQGGDPETAGGAFFILLLWVIAKGLRFSSIIRPHHQLYCLWHAAQ